MADTVKVVITQGERIVTIEVDRADLAHQTMINAGFAVLDKRRPGQPMLDNKGHEMSASYDTQAIRIADRA